MYLLLLILVILCLILTRELLVVIATTLYLLYKISVALLFWHCYLALYQLWQLESVGKHLIRYLGVLQGRAEWLELEVIGILWRWVLARLGVSGCIVAAARHLRIHHWLPLLAKTIHVGLRPLHSLPINARGAKLGLILLAPGVTEIGLVLITVCVLNWLRVGFSWGVLETLNLLNLTSISLTAIFITTLIIYTW